MGTNINSIPAGVVRAGLEGLESELVPVIDRIQGIQRFDVAEPKGIISIMPSEATLAGRITDEAALGIAEGVDAPVIDFAMDDISYRVARLARAGLLTEGVKRALVGNQVGPLQMIMRLPVMEVVALINRQLTKVLKDTTLNTTKAAGTAWNATNATPLKNIQDAIRKIGGKGAQMVGIFGQQQANDLLFNSDFTGRLVVDAGTSGVSQSFMAQVISEVTGLGQIIIADSLYNSANPGQALALGYEFDGVAWIGYARDLIYVEQGPFNAVTTYDASKESDLCVYSRRTFIGRGHKEMGVVITGVR